MLLFDERFKFDNVNSYVAQVSGSPGKNTFDKFGANAVTVKNNGYAYIYISNESDELVYFDNLMFTHERGRILEETHYYPFGLTMAGISSKAINFGWVENKYKFNNGTELNSELGLEWYETKHRGYDAQIGRFHQMDPLLEETSDYSPFSFVQNNPLLYNDPLGLDTVRVSGEGRHNIKIRQGDVLAWTIGETTSYYTYDPGNSNAVNGFVGGGIDEGSLPGVTVTGTKNSGSGINANGLWMLWGAREYYAAVAGSLKGQYTRANGVIDYATGSAARTELKSLLRNRATPYPLRLFLDEKYPDFNKYNPVTKPNPRFWYTNPKVTWGMRGLGAASLTWDIAGLYNYYNNPTAFNVVSPGNFALNTSTTGVMTFGGAVGFGVGFYFTMGRMAYSNFKEMPLEQQNQIISTQGPGGAIYYIPQN